MEKKNLTASVIIPAYNEEKRIYDCLKSIADQTEKPDEIIVVNNNSKDKTVQIAKSFGASVVNEKNQGMIYARNRGFNEATGDIIARTDADTKVPNDWVKRIKAGFTKDKNLVGISGPATYYNVPSDLINIPRWFHNAYFKSVKDVLHHDCLFGPNMAIRKSAWQKVKNEVCLEDNAVHEDIDLTIHISQYGKILFDKKLIVNVSFRRWKKLTTYFEYPYRTFKTMRHHQVSLFEERGKYLVKKVIGKKILHHINTLRHLPEYL